MLPTTPPSAPRRRMSDPLDGTNRNDPAVHRVRRRDRLVRYWLARAPFHWRQGESETEVLMFCPQLCRT
jgi:hypothetical protein